MSVLSKYRFLSISEISIFFILNKFMFGTNYALSKNIPKTKKMLIMLLIKKVKQILSLIIIEVI